MEGAGTAEAIETVLELSKLSPEEKKLTKVFLVSAKTHQGMNEAFSWLLNTLDTNAK